MQVLGIETSCDETGIALIDNQSGLKSHAVFSQTEIHAQYGGVVPELASRDHIRKTIPLVRRVLADSRTTPDAIDGIAYTAGPGLMGALLVGAAIARSLAWAWRIPAIGIHHMEGHLLAPMLETNKPEPPFVALLVSGGHTLLVRVAEIGQYELLGESLDDAAGEAFDKTAKLLGLGYPGGPALAQLALKGNARRYTFPRPMTNRPGLDFSFSGLKTFAVNTLAQSSGDDQTRRDIARAFEEAVVDTLILKCKRALQFTGLSQLVIAGGVGANRRLREAVTGLEQQLDVSVFYPRLEFCTDNGAMIAYAGLLRLQAGEQQGRNIKAKARWPLTEVSPLKNAHEITSTF